LVTVAQTCALPIFTNVRLVLSSLSGTVLKDTVVTIAGQDSVVIETFVTINGSEQLLQALVELRDGSTVLFAGLDTVIARTSIIPSSAPPPTIPLEFVGPGVNAVTLSIAPHDTTIFTSDSVALHASAMDSN